MSWSERQILMTAAYKKTITQHFNLREPAVGATSLWKSISMALITELISIILWWSRNTLESSRNLDFTVSCRMTKSRKRKKQNTSCADPWQVIELTIVCGLGVLLALALLRGFFSRFSGFPPSAKTSNPARVDEAFFLIYFFYLFNSKCNL